MCQTTGSSDDWWWRLQQNHLGELSMGNRASRTSRMEELRSVEKRGTRGSTFHVHTMLWLQLAFV